MAAAGVAAQRGAAVITDTPIVRTRAGQAALMRDGKHAESNAFTDPLVAGRGGWIGVPSSAPAHMAVVAVADTVNPLIGTPCRGP